LAVKRVQRFEVFDEDGADLGGRFFGQVLAGSEVMADLVKDPRPALRGATDQQAIGARPSAGSTA